MELSVKGLIDIASHEGICLDWYYDSVGVATIGIGQTKYDGFDPKAVGTLTIQQVFDLYKRKIKEYEAYVKKLPYDLKQHQYDALTSLCYNFGPGNLRTLCANRTLEQVGVAIMYYLKPPEIRGRRQKEQTLFLTGQYSNTDGKVLVFPVENHKPVYKKGYYVDVRPYLDPSAGTEPAPENPPTTTVEPTATAPEPKESVWVSVFRAVIAALTKRT